MPSKLSVLINTTPLETEHAGRGIGTYTRLLVQSLQELDLIVLRSSIAEENRQHFDIVHYPFFDLFFSTLPLNLKTKTVVTIHDVIPLLYPEQYKPGLKGALSLKKQKLFLKTTKAVITDSETSKTDIHQHLAVPLKKIFVVPLAANPALHAQGSKTIQETKEKYSLPAEYILYVGDINYNKNITQLIKTLKYLPDHVHLVCVGKNFKPQDIPEWHWIQTQIAMSDVESRVHFLTNILVEAVDELAAIYTGALCYLQPSLYEGFGLPILEAMQCKTPVVSSNTPALLEIGNETALFAEPTAEAFAAQVDTVMSWSKNKREDHIKKAFTWSQRFTWRKTAENTLEVYKSI